MENAHYFRDKLASGEVLLGTCITFIDPTITESLSRTLDFVWIDTEHNPLSLERVQGHIMATKGSQTTPLVRVPANDPVLIKPVLDMGAAGVIVPLVKSVADVELAVAACRYPPEGIRGVGPRRASDYGRNFGPEYCAAANRSVITIVQIEQREALDNMDGILRVPGLTSVAIGPNDLAASLGFIGQPRHAEVIKAIDTILVKAKAARIPVGISVGDDATILQEWIDKGMKWLAMGADFSLLVNATSRLAQQLRPSK